ncbi:MAG: EAL domain-containing protein [Rhodospirillaceae bacterium]
MVDQAEDKPIDTFYRDFFNCSIVGMYRTTKDGQYGLVNSALVKMYGFESAKELSETYQDIGNQLYVDSSRRNAFAKAISEGGEVTDFDAEIYRRDGSRIWIREHARCVRGADGNILYYEGAVTDITAQKKAEQQVQLLVAAFKSVAEGVIITSHDLTVQWSNPAFSKITGYSSDEVINKTLILPIMADDTEEIIKDILNKLRHTTHWQGELYLKRKNGERFLALLSVAVAVADEIKDKHFVLVCTDITQRKIIEEKLKFHANYDALTTLPNRVLLHTKLDQELERARISKLKVAVYYIDLDRFKPVNDQLGHKAGDLLLKLVAKRMVNSLRLSDTVGRLGGDEFLAIAPDISEPEAAAYVAAKLCYAFSDPFDILGHKIYCTASIGIAYYPDHATGVDALIANADTAMYHAKKNSRNQYCIYNINMRKEGLAGINLESDLRRAVQSEEFVLHYQPKVDLVTGIITSAEALIRWNHSILGWVSPTEFIPLAEKIGLIQKIGLWTLRVACRQMKEWLKSGSTIHYVAVNLSPHQFNDDALLDLIAGVLAETGLDAGALELELTEGAIITDVEHAVAMMHGLKNLGVRLAIDDFGTGYSSLTYLKHFPIDTLKIDGSFVVDLEHDRTDQAIVSTILELGRNLGLTVIAEGVETKGQLDYLVRRNCNGAQGFLIARPMEGSAVSALVDASSKSEQD